MSKAKRQALLRWRRRIRELRTYQDRTEREIAGILEKAFGPMPADPAAPLGSIRCPHCGKTLYEYFADWEPDRVRCCFCHKDVTAEGPDE